MMEAYYKIIENILPFVWIKYDFMKNALLAVVCVTPLFALVGTMVVGKRMAFFSDVLGHSALTGIALGVLLGFRDPFWAMLVFIVVLAVAVNAFKGITKGSSDTVLGVFFAVVVALGIVILSKGGGFSKFTSYLIGDILAVSPPQIIRFAALSMAVTAYWAVFGNNLVVISVNQVLARSRGVRVLLVETSFVVVIALLVAFSIRLVGILMINSLLVLPAAAARNIAGNVRDYTFLSIAISLFSGISGLVLSYYWGTSTGATIVLVCAGCYLVSAAAGKCRGKDAPATLGIYNSSAG